MCVLTLPLCLLSERSNSAANQGLQYPFTLSESSEKRECVLNFEPPEAPQSRQVTRTLQDRKDIFLVNLASPLDFINCVEQGYKVITLIGHGLIGPNNFKGERPVPLAYFRNLQGAERDSLIAANLQSINSQLGQMNPWLVSGIESDFASPDERNQVKRLLQLQRKLKNYPPGKAFYQPATVLPHAFQVAREFLRDQFKTKGRIHLEKIRLMSCFPHQVLAFYEDLTGLIQDNSLVLDLAPINKFWSYIEGAEVTSVSEAWLNQ